MARRCAGSPPRPDTFSCRRKGGLRALNYAYVTGDPEQFHFPFSEMRGLIVNEASEIAARPFQKFFNWQEPDAAVTACPWDNGCEITTKIDGFCSSTQPGAPAANWSGAREADRPTSHSSPSTSSRSTSTTASSSR